MKRKSLSPLPRVIGLAPRGVTLSEVLVSMLVMGIGVVAVATIFPLSVLRTIQATQLTHATQLRYNFEGLSGYRPELISGAGEWQPNTNYAQGDLVVSRSAVGSYFECQQAGTSGVEEKNLLANQPDGTVSWLHRHCEVYVVDPLGWQERTEEMHTLGLTPALNQANIRNTFGRTSLGTNPSVHPVNSPYRIVRFRGGVPRNYPPFTTTVPNPHPSSATFFPPVNSPQDIAARNGARELATLPDSWVVQFETTDPNEFQLSPPSAATFFNSQSRLVETLDRNGDSQLDFQGAERDVSARITFFNSLGTRSVTRPITTVTIPSAGSETITWAGGSLPALPAGDGWGRARVETWEQRYSWLLAVRVGQNDTLSMDLVVFFRRSFAPEDELIHPAHFRQGEQRVVVKFHSDPVTSVVTRPFLQRGGYLCDAQNNRWYRIAGYDEVADALSAIQQMDGSFNDTNFSGPGAVIRLETPVQQNSGIYTPSLPPPPPPPPPAPGGAMFLRGIVEVYPLQQR